MDFKNIIHEIKEVYETKRELNEIIINTKMEDKFLSDDKKKLLCELKKQRENYNSLKKITEIVYEYTHPVEFFLSTLYS